MASLVGERREAQDLGPDGDMLGMESINLERYLDDSSRIFLSAVMLTRQLSLERRELRINSSEDEISDHSSSTLFSRSRKNSK